MEQAMIFGPFFAMMFLTIVVWVYMYIRRISFITTKKLSPKDLARAVDMLNERKPHVTVMTGDVITQPGDPLDDAIRELGRLRADAGVPMGPARARIS